MAGKLYGIGVGPGDPELLTLKAVRLIESCDLIGIPAKGVSVAFEIARQAVPSITEKEILSVDIPMTKDREKLEAAYHKGCEEIIDQLEKGKDIAFLNLGDPTIYGTYMVLHEKVLKLGYEAELVSGVPSFCAVAATLGISLGARKDNIHIIPGSYERDKIEEYQGTKILMKSAREISKVKEELIQLEEKGRIKAYAVTNCGMEDETVCKDIRQLDEKAGYFTTIILKEK